AALHQPGVHERVEVAVEHAVDVADFDLGAGVLAHLVGLEDVGADLAAEVDVELGVLHLAGGGAFFLELELVEARAQDLHRHVLVFVLGALVLALDDDVGGEVDDAHGGVGHVDVLSALAAGAEGVDAQVLLADVDLDAVVDLGADEDAGEGGVAALGLIEGRDAHQAVDAGFGLEQTVGVVALDREGGRLDAGFLALLAVVERDLKAVALGPARVHAQQHLGPVLALGAAGAGVDGENRVERIVLAAEQGAGFDLVERAAELFDGVLVVLKHGLALAGELAQGAEVVEGAGELLVVVEQFLEAFAGTVDGLGAGGVAPEVGGGGLLVERLELAVQRGRVKDTPGRRGPWRPVPGGCARDRRGPLL